MESEFEIFSLAEPEDFDRYTEIFSPTDTPKPFKKLSWLHLNNPSRQSYVNCYLPKEDTSVTAALYAVVPIEFKIGNKVQVACQSLDTITDERFRGQGLFITLAESVYQRCTSGKVAFVYGFPNIHSAKGFFRGLKWKNIASPPFLTKPFKTKYFTDKLLKRKIFRNIIPQINLYRRRKIHLPADIAIKEITRFENDANTVWADFSQNINIAIERNKEYLNWRIFDNPDEEYKARGLYHNNKLVGYIIYSIKDKHGGRIGYVMDFIYRPSYVKFSKYLLFEAFNDMRDSNVDASLCWSFDHSPNYGFYKKYGFLKIPEKYQLIKLFFGARPFEKLEVDINNVENWYLSYLDSDTN